jgi:hypothetical protein
MIPIKLQSEKELTDISPNELQDKILEICKRYHSENRALAFAFIFFDFNNPSISEVLSNFKYWKALDTISGKYLTVFHFNYAEEYFAEDLKRFEGIERRQMHNFGTDPAILSGIKNFIELDQNIKIPSILFFQTDGKKILDYFIIELKEERIEESFLEIRDYIKSAVDSLSGVQDEYKDNRQPIFNLIKSRVTSTQMKKNFKKRIDTFPLNLFLGWLVGKM